MGREKRRGGGEGEVIYLGLRDVGMGNWLWGIGIR